MLSIWMLLANLRRRVERGTPISVQRVSVAGVIGVLFFTFGVEVRAMAQASTQQVLFVASSEKVRSVDAPLLERLVGRGFEVRVFDDGDIASMTVSDFDDYDLVWVSSTVRTSAIKSRLNEVEVPVGTHKASLLDDFGLARRPGLIRDQQEIVLADGTTATVTSQQRSLTRGIPSEEATVLATSTKRGRVVSAWYQTGAELIDGSLAAGCRAWTFPSVTSAPVMTEEGFSHFDAVIDLLANCDRSLPNRPPTLAAIEDATAQVGDDVTIEPTADDPDGDTLTFSAVGLPVGISIDATTGVLAGSPAEEAATVGGHAVTVTVADLDGAAASASFVWTIIPYQPPPPPLEPGEIENVVVILTDDMRLDEYAYMPKTQALLGDEGVEFTQAVQNTPVCCPARATLLTGQRSKNHEVHTNIVPDGQGYEALNHDNTLATWFQDQGWFTSHIGKYMNGYGHVDFDPEVPNREEIPPGWDDFQTLVGDIRYTKYRLNDNGTVVWHGSDPSDYQTDQLAVRAKRAIDEAVAAEEPFYVWVSAFAPHGFNGNPPRPADRHASLFDGATSPRQPNYNEADVSDKPNYIRRTAKLSSKVQKRLDREWENRLESLQAVDDLVEGIYNKLEANGQLESTLIVFLSDNGYLLGEHRLEHKVRPYEESIRVPLVMRGGPFVGGVSVDHVVSSVDVVPTIVRQTGITPGLVMDGLDLSEVLANPALYEDRAVIVESVTGPGYDALRTERWMWVEYLGSGRELYDLVNDPYQLESLHRMNEGEYPAVREALAALLATQRDCTGEDCVVYSSD